MKCRLALLDIVIQASSNDRICVDYLDSWDAFLHSQGAAPGRVSALVRALFFRDVGSSNAV